jgi:HSP20 family protein
VKIRLPKWNLFKFRRKAPRNTLPGLREPYTPERWFGDFSPESFEPRVDVVDDGDALRISAEMPGLDRNDIEILVADDSVVLRGEKSVEKDADENGCYRIERAYGAFVRRLPLPENVDAERAQARFDKGVLTLHIPKRTDEGSGERRIPIN